MTAYTADAVAMMRYLAGVLPGPAKEIFDRAERGIDAVEAPDVALAEVLTLVGGDGVEVAGERIEMNPNEALRRLVVNGPVSVASIGEHELVVFASEIDLYTMHDGLVAATHRVHGTEAVVSKDEAFRDAGPDTVWD